MTYNGQTFDVQVEAGIHTATGQVYATLQSIDPNTNLPPDVLTGFLPPENGTGRGTGSLSFLVSPKADLATGTQIRNVAYITFDQNGSIATDQVDDDDPSKGVDPSKQALVTIDAGAPTSSVAALPAVSSTKAFTVSWSGSDDTGGSGLASYSIYVSDNGGSFTPWLTATTQTSATYDGLDGHTYGFYSIATDNVGNVQTAPTSAQATTTVDSTPPQSSVSSLPTYSPGTFTVGWSGSDANGIGIASYSVYMSDNGATFVPWLTNTTLTSSSFTGVNGHSYGFYSVATDKLGNTQPTPSGAQATTLVDAIPPTSSVNALPAFTDSTSFTVSYTASDPGSSASGLAEVNIYVKGPTDSRYSLAHAFTGSSLSNGNFSYSASEGDGSYAFYSVATDNVGNVQATPSSANTTTLLDTAAPTSSASSPQYSSSKTVTVSYTASDPNSSASGLAEVDVYVEGPTDSSYSLAHAFTGSSLGSGNFSFTASEGDGSYAFISIATDKAGNVQATPGSAYTTTLLDTAAPTSSATSPQYTNSKTFTASYTASDPGSSASGLAEVDLYVKGPTDSSYSLAHAFTGSSLSSGSFSFNASEGDGSYAFYTIATDKAGNIQATPSFAQATSTVDSVAPSSGVAALPAYSLGSFTVSWSGSDNTGGSGLASYSVYVSDNNGAFTPLLTNTTKNSTTFSGQNGHVYGFYSVATDVAGNVQATPGSAQTTTTVESVPPPIPTITSGPGSTSSSSSATFAFTDSQSGVTFLSKVDNGSYAATSSPQTVTGLGNGSHTFYVEAKDQAGNISSAASYTWTVSLSSSPTVVSTKVDDGTAQRSMVRSITLTFSGSIASTLSSVMAVLSLTRASDNLSVGLKGTLDSTGKILTLTFTGSSIIGGSLADGRYTLGYAGSILLAAGNPGQSDENEVLVAFVRRLERHGERDRRGQYGVPGGL